MALTIDSPSRNVTGISRKQKLKITAFLQGAVYSWSKNSPNEWFSMRDLMGGENNDWQKTPLQALYLKHVRKRSSNPVKQAGQDSGWLLKSVLINDRRWFDTRKTPSIRQYRWKKRRLKKTHN